MPNYRNAPRRQGSAGKNESGLSSWFKKREQRKQEIREEAAKLVTNKLADNERKFVDLLGSIDFRNSRIPKEILDNKTKETQPCGDLEFFVRGLISHLQRNPQVIKSDIRSIDEKIMAIILLFRQSIEQGDVRAAYAARFALTKAFNEIRLKLPQQQAQLVKPFVEESTKYLDQWITCIQMAQLADRTELNVKISAAEYERSLEKRREKVASTLDMLKNDPVRSEALDFIKTHDSMTDRLKWTELQREVHDELVEENYNMKLLDLKNLDSTQQKELLQSIEAKYEYFKVKLYKLVVVSDPNLMNKFKEAMDEMFKEFAKNDVEIQETLTAFDDYSERVRSLMNARGQQMLSERAAQEADRLVEDAKKLQKTRLGVSEGGMKETVGAKYGIMTEEEEAVYLRQKEEEAERERQRILNESAQIENELSSIYEENNEDQGEELFN